MDHGSTLASGTEFPYPPLPSKEDAIRILTIEPGDFDDQINSTLTPVTFGARPKYMALSYTWGNPYPDNPEETDVIFVNTHYFSVRPNLSLALRHLRSPKYPLAIWVDAICINQKNTKELNEHVAMMSFIYRRAFMVVAWLGIRKQFGSFQFMRREWESGQTQHLAEYVDSSKRMSFSYEPDPYAFWGIPASSYWSRLWIVQEACLPHQLAFAFGSKIWDYEDLCRWQTLEAEKTKLSRSEDDLHLRTGLKSMIHLLDARDSRHTEDMALVNLLERFSEAACSEIRDKIYGLLGLANDVTPYSSANEDVDAESLTPWAELVHRPPGGRGMFKVDYSQSLYEVWAEVVKHVYFRAKSVGGKHTGQVPDATSLSTIGMDALITQEWHLDVVRTSGLVQEVLEQRVEEDRERPSGFKVSIPFYYKSTRRKNN